MEIWEKSYRETHSMGEKYAMVENYSLYTSQRSILKNPK